MHVRSPRVTHANEEEGSAGGGGRDKQEADTKLRRARAERGEGSKSNEQKLQEAKVIAVVGGAFTLVVYS